MHIVIDRAYGGLEGKRVMRGTEFWAGAPDAMPDALKEKNVQVISLQRGNDLIRARIARRADEPEVRAAPGARPFRTAAPVSRTGLTSARVLQRKPQEHQTIGRPLKVPVPPRRRNQAEPPPPRRVTEPNLPAGSQDGPDPQSSSSQADPASETSTSAPRKRLRGQRSDGSQSTIPGDLSHGQTSPTPPTPDGGSNTDETSSGEDPAAFA